MALARVVVDEQLAHGLGHSVGGLRRLLGQVAHGSGHRGSTETGDAAGEDHPRSTRSGSSGFKNIPPAVEIHPQGIVVMVLAFAAHHRGEMKDGNVFCTADGLIDHVTVADVPDYLPHFLKPFALLQVDH